MPVYVELTNLLEIGLLKLKHDGSEEKCKQLLTSIKMKVTK
jgi:hypothetical protein